MELLKQKTQWLIYVHYKSKQEQVVEAMHKAARDPPSYKL